VSKEPMFYRFVGGPWHNRHVKIRGMHRIEVPVPQKLPITYDPEPTIAYNCFETQQYELTAMRTYPWGTPFFEYHVR
jgi:hypothetical protein